MSEEDINKQARTSARRRRAKSSVISRNARTLHAARSRPAYGHCDGMTRWAQDYLAVKRWYDNLAAAAAKRETAICDGADGREADHCDGDAK